MLCPHQIPCIHWSHWIPIPLRENSNETWIVSSLLMLCPHQISWFHWNHWITVPFRENSISTLSDSLHSLKSLNSCSIQGKLPLYWCCVVIRFPSAFVSYTRDWELKYHFSKNKKVLLYSRKRHTDHSVFSTPSAVLLRGYLRPGPEGGTYPGRGYLPWPGRGHMTGCGTPQGMYPHLDLARVGTPPPRCEQTESVTFLIVQMRSVIKFTKHSKEMTASLTNGVFHKHTDY